MFASTASGFTHTPVTKFIIYFSVIIPILTSLLEIQYLFDYSITPHLLVWHQWWRLLINQIIYVNQSEVLLGLLLLYNFRVIERLMGSPKFLSFIIVIQILNSIVVPIIIYTVQLIPYLDTTGYVPSGPTPTIFSLLWLYHTLVPAVYRFQISPVSSNGVKVQISDKVFLYFVAVQLSTGYLPTTIISALVGWTLSGLVYYEVIPLKNWRVPFSKRIGKDKSRRARVSPPLPPQPVQ